jgi:hypothetical protein
MAIRWFLILTLLLHGSLAGGADVAAQPVRLGDLKSIHITPGAKRVEAEMAERLRRDLARLYRVQLPLVTDRAEPSAHGIVVGRAAAEASGAVSGTELDALGRDGYVLRTDNQRIVVAGREPQGTVYATYALLRRLGLRLYPWHGHGGLELFEPLPQRVLPPLDLKDQPYFEYRSVLAHEDRGRYGGTLPELVLGDLQFAHSHPYFKDRGWLGWDHTAAWLVPPARYQAEHPEYFAERPAWEMLKPVSNIQTALCTCAAGIDGIASQRALEWIATQPDRRYFAITDGDVTRSRCPHCAATDPTPDYYTDRLLTWVNSVARTVHERHPDKTLLTLAYMGTVKPPRATGLESNVLVMYSPWYWTSRATSATALEAPFNVKAGEELTAWAARFPDQVGVYDYPDDWAWGAAARVQDYAGLGIRWVYMNGPRGNLLHWLSSQLLWDPGRDPEALAREFIEASYGPAAGPMLDLALLEKNATAVAARAGTLRIFTDTTLTAAAPLIDKVVASATSAADPATRVRILEGASDALGRFLREARYQGVATQILRKHFPRYLHLQSRLLSGYRTLGRSPGETARLINAQLGRLDEVIGESGRRLDESDLAPEALAGRLAESGTTYDRVLRARQARAAIFPSQPIRWAEKHFAGPDELQSWRGFTSATPLPGASSLASVTVSTGQKMQGVRVAAPLTRLPVVRLAGTSVHAGRYFAERRFEPALDARGLPFIELHLHSSAAVPVTLYLNRRDRLRSDVVLDAGEQVVRVDLRNYWDTRFDPAAWDGRIHELAIDVWPQDILYPFPPAKDTQLVLFGVRATNQVPDLAALARQGRQGWVSQFAANVPFGDDKIRSLAELAAAAPGNRTSRGAVSTEYLNRGTAERFRSFTEHRILAPPPSQMAVRPTASPARKPPPGAAPPAAPSTRDAPWRVPPRPAAEPRPVAPRAAISARRGRPSRRVPRGAR